MGGGSAGFQKFLILIRLETLKRTSAISDFMSVDEDLLQAIMDGCGRKFRLVLDGKAYDLSDVAVRNSPVPVSEPTTRGGAYFAEKFAYKMSGIVRDLSVIPMLTPKMLGPNTEFGELVMHATIEIAGAKRDLELSANLVSSVQMLDSIELHMIITRLDS